MYLNIGSGTLRYENTVNLDITVAKDLEVDVQGDARNLPFKDKAFDGIIASHVLEHISKGYHTHALGEWRRVIKDDTFIYIEVPDFEECLKNFLSNHLGMEKYWYDTIFGRCAYPGDEHKSGVTKRYLTDLLFNTGFENLKWIGVQGASKVLPFYNQAIMAVKAKKAKDLPPLKV